jgi:cell division protein FtsW
VLIAVALLMLGVVMVTSAGLSIDTGRFELRDILMSRQALFAVLAVAMLWAGSTVPLPRLCHARGVAAPAPWIVLAIVVLLVLVHVPGVGREVNGARRWITLGPIGFQPSEIAKWGILVVLAWYGARNADRMHRFLVGFGRPMIVILLVCGLIGTEDLGTAMLIGAVSVAVLLAAGARIRHAAMLLPVGAAAFVAGVIQNPYRLERLRTFIDPYKDPQNGGYHMVQSMAAVSGGGLPGRGLGNSVQKFGYLPEDTTDFIFAIICEELGAVGAIVVVSLYAALMLCGLAIVRRARQPFARLLGVGILLTIGVQAVINLAVVTGAGPTKGIALPLVSAGGTGWVLTALCIGLLVAVEREERGPGFRVQVLFRVTGAGAQPNPPRPELWTLNPEP